MAADPPSDDEFDELDDAELFRLAAGLERRKLPEDVVELMWAIAEKTFVRMGEPDAPPYQFEGFEALDTKFGGMGMVIEARDPQLDRKVAIKLWMSSGPAAEAALLAEAKTLAKLSHPNIVTVYETGTWNDRVYFVMEWVEGVDGHEWMQTPRSWRTTRDVFAAAGAGLAAAHDAGIAHRDFKPANMLVGNNDRVLVADFGVADSLCALDAGDDQPKQLVGTPSYMAPERLRGERGDARSDQFSFCVAMWRGLHGLPPYRGNAPEQLLEAIEGGTILPGPPSSDTPHWLSRVVRKGLELDPDRRHRDMHELVRALHDEPPGEGESSVGEPDGRETIVPDRRLLNTPVAGESWRFFLYGSMTGIVLVMMVILGLEMFRGGERRTVATNRPVPATTSESEPRTPQPPEGSLWSETGDTGGSVDEPFGSILGMIERGEFTDAHTSWLRERSMGDKLGLTDDESLVIGRACLERARQLRQDAPTLAKEAKLLAAAIATFVENSGATADARVRGRQLHEDYEEFHRTSRTE